MFKRITAFLSVLALLFALDEGCSPSAQAAPGRVTCNSGLICFFNGTDGSGLLQSNSAGSFVINHCYAFNAPTNNAIGYIKNASGWLFYVWDTGNCSGTLTSPVYPNSQGAMNSTWNNKISSIMRLQIS